MLGAALLNANGEVLRFGGEVMKNVAGYDVSRLLVGSLGILGPILEVSLKVLPMPPAHATLRFEWPQAKALAAAAALGRPAAAAARQRVVERHAGGAARRRRGGGACGHAGARRRVVDAAAAARFWSGLRDQRDEFFGAAADAVNAGATLWRVSVATHAPPLATEGEQLIEWHGGQRWIVNQADAATMRALAAASRRPCHGVSRPKAAAHSRRCRAVAAHPSRAEGALRSRPLFNPGRLYPDL